MNGQPPTAALEELVELIACRVAEHLRENQPRQPERDERSPWMSVDTAATYLDWPKQRLYKLTAAGRIPHSKVDGRLLFHREQLDHWLRGFTVGAAE